MGSDFYKSTIGEQVTLQRGFDITKKDQLPGEVPVVSSGGISSYHNESKATAPGVILGRKGSLGTVFFLKTAYWPHDTTLWVKDFKGNNPRFVYYFFNNMAAELKRMDVGAANPALNRNHVHPLPIIWAEKSAQNKIAHILGSLDDKIELNRQMNATLEAMAQALFKSWFVDFDPVIDNALAAGHPIPEPLQSRAEARAVLGDQRKPLPEGIQQQFPNRFVFNEDMGWVPEGWTVSSFGEVSTCFDSKRIPLSKKQREGKKPGCIPYYGATSVMDYINDWIFDDIYLILGEDGSVIKEDGTPFVQYIWGRAWVNNHAHVLQGKNDVSTEHLMLFIRDQNMSAYVTGAVQPKINQKNMNSIPYLNATPSINNFFSCLIAPYFDKLRSYNEQIKTLENLRDTLLPQLLSGQLRIPEAEQQVANML